MPFVHVGDMADVADGANPDRKVQARIARTSDQLDPRTRTLFVELDVDNSEDFLVPGSFAYVTLHVPVPSYPEIPVAALIVRGTNTFIANVGKDSTCAHSAGKGGHHRWHGRWSGGRGARRRTCGSQSA